MTNNTTVREIKSSGLFDGPEGEASEYREVLIRFTPDGTPEVTINIPEGQWPISRKEFNLLDRALRVRRRSYSLEITTKQREAAKGAS